MNRIFNAIFIIVLSILNLNDSYLFTKHVTRHRTKCLKGSMVECPEGEFDKYVTDSKGAVVVDFMANWCGPCKLMNPIFKSLAEEYDSVDFVKVDTDIHEDTVDKFNLQGLPLFGIFIDGKMVASHSGALGKDSLRSFVNKFVQPVKS